MFLGDLASLRKTCIVAGLFPRHRKQLRRGQSLRDSERGTAGSSKVGHKTKYCLGVHGSYFLTFLLVRGGTYALIGTSNRR